MSLRPPSGTVTFAFTDIEGSTVRWERDRAAMQDAVRRHDALLHAVLGDGRGYVFKTVGDEFCCAFERPEDAVAAVLAVQRALANEDFSAVGGLRVRAAIHTGTADEREGDYFGPAVNRVARLLAIGHGGQTLVSGVVADLVPGLLPPQTSLRDLGEHRLKDLARPEHVHQLLAPDLPSDFPPLRSLDALPNNLPRMPTSFVGRELEIAEVTALLDTHQLVTLVGSGGVGKTRLSLQVAANLVDGSGAGVWFIELAPLASGDYLPSTVAQALGITLPTGGNALEHLVQALAAKRVLLVFDNCEHMLEPAADAIAAILRGCPKVDILASSRQSLGLAGEVTYRVPAFAIPSAIAFFVERARAADPHFELTAENEPALAEICRRLDGIALAIELAASRVKMLSPQQIQERLDQRFRVLTGGSRDALPRQQTLRALIDWSHDLLDERERTLFRRLAIFVNGLTLEGAVAVGSGDDLDELDVFDVLAALVDKSLVLAEPGGPALRYSLLESTRAYAAEKLTAAGERALIADRHLQYLRARYADERERYQRIARRAAFIESVTTELEDLRAALDWALERPDVPSGAGLLADIGRGWRGSNRECIARINAFLAVLPPDEGLLRARLTTDLVERAIDEAEFQKAFDLASVAVAVSRAVGDGPAFATALVAYADSTRYLRRFDDGERALREAEAIAGGIAPALRLELLFVRALSNHMRGDFDSATRGLEELRALHHSLGNESDELSAVLCLAESEHARGQTRRAIEIVRDALPLVGARDKKLGRDIWLANLAGYLVAVDDLPGALTAAREALGNDDERGLARLHAAMAVEHLALAIALAGDALRAGVLEGYAEAAWIQTGGSRERTEKMTQERLMALLRERLAPDELARVLAEGAALSTEAAVALALSEPSDP